MYRETVGERGRGDSDTSSINSDYKSDGLIKKTFRIDGTSGKKRHLVSYYSYSDLDNGMLRLPLEFPQLAGIQLSPEVYPDYVNEGARGSTPPIPRPSSSNSNQGGFRHPIPNQQHYHPQSSQQSQYQPQQQQQSNQQQQYQPQQQEEKAAAYYYQQQAQQRRFNSSTVSSPLNSERFDSPTRHGRAKSMPNSSHALNGKRKGGPDGSIVTGESLRSSGSQYFTHIPGTSTGPTSVDTSQNSSREGSPGPSSDSPGWNRVLKKFEQSNTQNDMRSGTLVSPLSQNSHGSPISKAGSGGPYGGSPSYRAQISSYQLNTPTSAESHDYSNSPTRLQSMSSRQEGPINSSSLKNELVPLRRVVGSEEWKKLSAPVSSIPMHQDIRRMSDIVKRRVSLLSPLVLPGKPRERQIPPMTVSNASSAAPSPSLSPTRNYIPDIDVSKMSIPSLTEGGAGTPMFLAHSTWTLTNERVFLSNEKL